MPAGLRKQRQRVVITMALGVIVGASWLLSVRDLAFRRVEKALPVPASAWARPASAKARAVAEAAVQSAALLDDPMPTAASWPVGTEAAWIEQYRGKLVTRFDTDQKIVALTFDDGPDGSTKKYVDLLESYGAKATFFFRGEDISPLEIRYAVGHGMEIGNHTGSHVGLDGQSPKTMAREMDAVDDQVYWVTGRKPLWVRARAGDVSAQGLSFVEERGQLYANWNVSAYDTNWGIGSVAIAGNVWRHVTPGSVVLMHQTRPETLEALPIILKELKAKGYRFLTLSEMAAEGKAPQTPAATTVSAP